jgi:hypothetical protein
MEIESTFRLGLDSVCPSKISSLRTVSFCGGILSEEQRLAALTALMQERVREWEEQEQERVREWEEQEQERVREWEERERERERVREEREREWERERERLLLRIQLQTLDHIQGPQSAGCAH